MNSLALIELQNRKLALPHHHILAIERCSRAQSIVRIGERQWDVVDLDDDLNWRLGLDYAAPFVVCFKRWLVALRCTRLDSIAASDLVPLPPIMYAPEAPVQGFIKHQDELVLVVDIESLILTYSDGRNGGGECNVMPGVFA